MFRDRSGLLALVIVIILTAAGIWAGWWRGYEARHRLEDELLVQAVEIANTIKIEVVKKLTFSASDLQNPAYHRLRNQMISYGRLIRQRGIYSMALRGDTIVFGPENYAEGDPMGAGPPGTPYLEPTEDDFAVFRTGVAVIEGPASDEYGTFVTALAPVVDPSTEKVLMVVGIDLLATEWQTEILMAWLLPTATTLLTLLLLLSGHIIVVRRNKGLLRSPERLWHTETVIVALTGILLTLTIAAGIHQKEKREQQLNFRIQSESETIHLKEQLMSIQRGMILLKNYFKNSKEVTQEEFTSFVSSMSIDPSVCTFLFMPGREDSLLFGPRNAAGRHMLANRADPAFRHIRGIHPKNNDVIRRLMEGSLLSGMPESDYLRKPGTPVIDSTLLLVLLPADTGFAMAIVDFGHLLHIEKAGQPGMGNTFETNLVDPVLKPRQFEDKTQAGQHISPIFIFGRGLAIISSPAGRTISLTANLTLILVLITGFSLTAMLTLFVRFIRNRQADLSAKVAERTADLVQAKEKAEESDRLKSAFLANMSHEIRTPMNAIVGFSSALADPSLNETERRRYIKIIRNRSDDLLRLINDILDISQIESGNATVIYQDININTLIRELRITFEEKLKNAKKEVALICDTPLEDAAADLVTDPYILRQVLSNLLDNAIKYTPEGSIRFGYEKPDQGTLTCFVADTGVGIDPAHQAQIFEHFRQSDRSDQQKYGGTGLGLAICKGSLALLGGTIGVESQPGKGSLFSFRIPYRPITDIPAEKPVIPAPFATRPANWAGHRLLIVEDDPANLEFLRTVLARTGAEIETADSASALRRFYPELDRFDVVLLDIRLPDANGWELMSEIRALRPSLPVLAQTAYAMESDRQRCEKAGFSGYLAKPISRETLHNTLGRWLKE
jgi:signal transduction histidine kinase